jgi:hypothetical protein
MKKSTAMVRKTASKGSKPSKHPNRNLVKVQKMLNKRKLSNDLQNEIADRYLILKNMGYII